MSLRLLGVTVVIITCVLCLLLKCLSSKYLPYENSVTAKTSSDIYMLYCTQISLLTEFICHCILLEFFILFPLNMCISGSRKNQITLLLLHPMMGIQSLLVRVMLTPPPKTAQSSPGAMM